MNQKNYHGYWGWCTRHGDYEPPDCPYCKSASERATVGGEETNQAAVRHEEDDGMSEFWNWLEDQCP